MQHKFLTCQKDFEYFILREALVDKFVIAGEYR